MIAGRSLKKGGFDKDTTRPLQHMFAAKAVVDSTIMAGVPIAATFVQDDASIMLTFMLCNFWRGFTLFATGGQVFIMRASIATALEGASGEKVESIRQYFNTLTKEMLLSSLAMGIPQMLREFSLPCSSHSERASSGLCSQLPHDALHLL